MLTKILTSAIVVLGSIAGLTVVSPSAVPFTAQAATTSVQPVQAAGVDESSAPPQMGTNRVQRAQQLVTNLTAILNNGKLGDYPFDYTGLVGYAWQLPKVSELDSYADWSAMLRTRHAVEVPSAMLEPGDIVMNGRGGDFGEAVLFERWLDPNFWRDMVDPTDQPSVDLELANGVRFVGIEMDRSVVPARVVEKLLTLKVQKGAISVEELEPTYAGPYFALRDNRIQGFVTMLDHATVLPKVTMGSTGYVEFSIINRGGSSVQVTDIGAVAYGPNADIQGLASIQTNFDTVPTVTLKPGEVYKYEKRSMLPQVGNYFVLSKFQVGGTMQIPMQMAYFQVVEK